MTQVRDNATVADEVDRLYKLPLEEFTAARNDLAKQLGDASVKQLKKPTVPAWTVNQLARTREVDVRRLLRAGEQLEQAQKQAVEGGDQQAFERARLVSCGFFRALGTAGFTPTRAPKPCGSSSSLRRPSRRSARPSSVAEPARSVLATRSSVESFAGWPPAPSRSAA